MRLKESPLYTALQAQGKSSKSPIKDAFGNTANWKTIFTVLFGAAAGQAVVWYTGQFYAYSWLQSVAGLSFKQAVIVLIWAIAFATPFFIFFGALSDRIGRKPIMLAGNLIAALAFIPIFTAMKTAAGPTEQFVTQGALDSSREVVALVQSGNNTAAAEAAQGVSLFFDQLKPSTELAAGGKEGTLYLPGAAAKDLETLVNQMRNSADPEIKALAVNVDQKFKRSLTALNPNLPMLIFWVWLLIIFVTMVYGPIAAFLVESFPAKIRYSSVSLPYHVGNGYFGGFTPYIATALVARTGNIYAGLYWPMAIALLTFVIGLVFLKDGYKRRIHDEVN